MSIRTNTQIQIRIDSQTKNQAKKILENLGLDISSAIKILLKQVINTGSFPVELRDVNGFRPHKAKELKDALSEPRQNKKAFTSSKELIKELYA